MSGVHLKRKDNLWILHNGKEMCIGLTKEAQEELGAVTFISLPPVGASFKQGAPLLEVEAEKAVSEFTSPISGTVASINDKIDKDISILNDQDEMTVWILSFKDIDLDEFTAL